MAEDWEFTKTILFTFAIGMIFASTTKLFKKEIKNIKQHFKNLQRSSVSPTNQDLSNDTTFSQIKSRIPVPLMILTNLLNILRTVICTALRNIGAIQGV